MKINFKTNVKLGHSEHRTNFTSYNESKKS